MASGARDRDREWLERELQTREHQALLRDLQRMDCFMEQFGSWSDVIAFMRAGSSRDPRKDDVLRPIFRAYGESRDPRWRTVLLMVFWPGLVARVGKEDHLDPDDPEELWQTIAWVFIRVVDRIDLDRRPARLVQKVMNDTIHDLREEYCRRRKRAYREGAAEPERIEWLAGGADGIGFEVLCWREAVEQYVSKLRRHLDSGRLSRGDFYMLIATRVTGVSLAEYARNVRLNYEVAKKRRQRAEAAIRRHEEPLE